MPIKTCNPEYGGCGVKFWTRYWKVEFCEKPECRKARIIHIEAVRKKCVEDCKEVYRQDKARMKKEGKKSNVRRCQLPGCFRAIPKKMLKQGYRYHCCHNHWEKACNRVPDSVYDYPNFDGVLVNV